MKIKQFSYYPKLHINRECRTITMLSQTFTFQKKVAFICFNESSLKVMKNAFYFILKPISFLRSLDFCRNFLAMHKNDLMKKLRLISKFMTSQTEQYILTVHNIYCPISQEVKATR